ncbi:MAG: hypothetical protein EOP07_07510 [Proteobacteria bacterium]|nr:MAG: hypothetical protein EOP07_07510 [Pseudomonadota bacterium]
MKDFSEQIEKELVGDWSGDKPMPDRIYFSKVLKRNLWVIICGLGLTALATYMAPLWVSDSYRSSVYAVFDHLDANSPDPTGGAAQVRYNTLARMFKARFESQDFAKQILTNLGESGLSQAKDPAHLAWVPFGKSTSAEEGPRSLLKQYEAAPETDSGILALRAFAPTAEQAQNLANVGMETFINRELDEQIKSLEIKLALLKKNVSAEPVIKAQASQSLEKTPAKRAEKLTNEDKEREFDERLRALNAQVDQVRRERDSALTNIKRDLVRLQTSFQANHPQVVEKKKELELVTSQYRSSEDKIILQANSVRGQLRAVRNSQSRVDSSPTETATIPDYQGSFFTNLSDRIKEIELEKQNLIQQKEDPLKRTRLQILYPASLEPIPFKNSGRLAQYGFLLSGVILTFLLVFFREWQTPLARDAWLIERITGKKIISQISHRNTHEYTNITPALADQMRSHLGKIHRIDEAASTLLSYRRLELSIMQECKGDVVLLINAGSQDMSAQVIKNFLNIYSTDHQDDYLLIDCNLQEPIFQYKNGERGVLSLAEFIDGKAKFEDVCINREQMDDFSFDVIPPMAALSGSQTRIFRPEKVVPAIDSIPFKYRKIFIRGMPAAHFIENRALLAAASDLVAIGT